MAEAYEQRKVGDHAQVVAECEKLESEIAELRASYEQYFLGIERKPPLSTHHDLKKRVQKLKGLWVRQTATKFRIQMVHSKFTSYERLWNRTMQEIENGTFKRDLAKVKRRVAAPKKAAEEKDDLPIDELSPEELSGDSLENAMAAAAASVSAPKVAPVAAAPATVPPVAPSIAPVAPVIAPVAPVVPPVAAARPAAAAPAGAPRVSPAVAPVVPPVASPSQPRITAPGVAPVAAAGQARPAAPGAPGAAPPARPSGPMAAQPRPGAPVAGAPARPAAPGAAPAAAARPGAPVGGGGNLSDDKLRAVYDAYVKAKRRCNEDTSSMSYEQVATTLRKQVPELMKQHNAKAVEFKVVIKDGKAVLRAVPKEG